MGPIADIQKNRTLVYEIVRFFMLCHIVVLAILAVACLSSGPGLFATIAIFSTVGGVVFLAFVLFNIGLLCDCSGGGQPVLGWANKLTFSRFLLAVPIVMLVIHDRMMGALALYVLSGLTDIADGIVARRTHRETEFGVVMDPAADIVTTAGLFAAFFVRGFIPAWVLIVLLARYVTLLAGAVVARIVAGPLKFKATPVGKIVGVLQAVAGILIIVLSQTDMEWRARFGGVLYPFLGVIFGSVIVSQLIIGVRHIKKGTQDGGS